MQRQIMRSRRDYFFASNRWLLILVSEIAAKKRSLYFFQIFSCGSKCDDANGADCSDMLHVRRSHLPLPPCPSPAHSQPSFGELHFPQHSGGRVKKKGGLSLPKKAHTYEELRDRQRGVQARFPAHVWITIATTYEDATLHPPPWKLSPPRKLSMGPVWPELSSVFPL